MPFYIYSLQNFHKPNLFYSSCLLNYIVYWKHKLPEDRQPLIRTTKYRLLLSDINFWRRCRGVSAYSRDNFFFLKFCSILYSFCFSFSYFFYYLFILLLWPVLFYCAWAFRLETTKVDWRLLRHFLEVYLIHLQAHPHLPSWLKKE